MGSIKVRNTVLQSFSMVESKELEREMKIVQVGKNALSVRSTSSSLTRPTLPMPDKDHQSPHHAYIVWSMMKL